MSREITRRTFLAGSATLAAGVAMPIWLRLGTLVAEAAPLDATSRKLIVLLLAGGNDGLNTVVPYADGAYHAARPSIGISAAQALKLPGSDTIGLSPALANLHAMYLRGRVAIVQGVGYDNPDLSHFSSMDVWQTGSPQHRFGTGWLGRYLDATPDRATAVRAVAIGNLLPTALVGASTSGVAIPSFASFTFADGADRDAASDGYRLHEAFLRCSAGNPADSDPVTQWLLRAQRDTVTAVRAVAALPDAQSGGPATLADAVEMAMTLLSSDLGVDIAFLTLASFDEHADNGNMHQRLLGDVDAALGRFDQLVTASPHPEAFLLCTMSEFGRRVAENGDRGTDHGTAAPHIIAGTRVAGGLYGAQPRLDPAGLDANGNMRRAVELREIYATLIDGWLGGASSTDVLGYTSADGLQPVQFLR
jgi:uncharacterized protein (DUF1501 family)